MFSVIFFFSSPVFSTSFLSFSFSESRLLRPAPDPDHSTPFLFFLFLSLFFPLPDSLFLLSFLRISPPTPSPRPRPWPPSIRSLLTGSSSTASECALLMPMPFLLLYSFFRQFLNLVLL